jgi:Domain found in Dishevelled, Egl-10, and Pleckstrin (DEP)
MFDTEHVNKSILILLEDEEVQKRAQERHERRVKKAMQLFKQKQAMSKQIGTPEARRLKHVREGERRDSSAPMIEHDVLLSVSPKKSGAKPKIPGPRQGGSLKLPPKSKPPSSRPVGGSLKMTKKEAVEAGAAPGALADVERRTPDSGSPRRGTLSKGDRMSQSSSALGNWSPDSRGSSSKNLLNDADENREEKDALKRLGKELLKDEGFSTSVNAYGVDGTEYPDSFTGAHAIDRLVALKAVASREEAVEKFSAMLRYGYLKHPAKTTRTWKDSSTEIYMFYTKNTSSGRRLKRKESSRTTLTQALDDSAIDTNRRSPRKHAHTRTRSTTHIHGDAQRDRRKEGERRMSADSSSTADDSSTTESKSDSKSGSQRERRKERSKLAPDDSSSTGSAHSNSSSLSKGRSSRSSQSLGAASGRLTGEHVKKHRRSGSDDEDGAKERRRRRSEGSRRHGDGRHRRHRRKEKESTKDAGEGADAVSEPTDDGWSDDGSDSSSCDSDVAANVDPKGVERGECEDCGSSQCSEYVNPKEEGMFACAYCGCAPVKHKQLVF